MKREFLLLANNYDASKYGVASWFMSEKLDGCRAFWDGGITRGLYADQVPFANVAKDARLVNRPKSTGLWSRYGKVIHAPDWWLDKLPPIPLDGELYTDIRGFQDLMSIVKQHKPGPQWKSVRYMVFDSPDLGTVFADGIINNTNFKKIFKGIREALKLEPTRYAGFENVFSNLVSRHPTNEVFQVLEQEQLPCSTKAAEDRITEKLFEVTTAGGEGLMLRQPSSLWVPERCKTLLKVKKMDDAEGIVTGYTWGRRTDLGSKLLGLMGALVLNYSGKRLELSGFTDAEREMALSCGAEGGALYQEHYTGARLIGELHAGQECDERVYNPLFPRGSVVSFKYRELSKDGIPKEARYWRRT